MTRGLDPVVTLYMIPYNVPLYKFILLSWGSLTTLLPWATFDGKLRVPEVLGLLQLLWLLGVLGLLEALGLP